MSTDYHEPASELSKEARDMTRALRSLIEEVEAVLWYMQRIDVATDEELKDIMQHNAEEEMEHAMMSLEWLRRNQKGWDKNIRTYLLKDKPILELEEEATSEENSSTDSTSLDIGEL